MAAGAPPSRTLVRRVTPLARAALVGAALASVLTLALSLPWGVRAASDLAFALGGVAFGFGLAAWAGALLFAPTIDAAKRHLGALPGWTERGARTAMSRLTAAGAGAMVAAALLGTALSGP